MCQICQSFLQDFLLVGIPKEIALAKQLRMKSIRNVLPELSDWIYRFYQKLKKEEFERASGNASLIARRGRALHDYEYLLQTATFNFLKYNLDWVSSEVSYIEILLMESGFVRTSNRIGYHTNAYNYISYIVPLVIVTLQEVHDNHVHPKGLQTDLSKLCSKRRTWNDKETCADRDDDYQKEILEEKDDDLYT
jgi:hypothetical protein